MIDIDHTDPESHYTRTVQATQARVPARFLTAEAGHPTVLQWIDSLTTEAQDLQARCQAVAPVIRTGPSLLLIGPTGTGKTHEAYGALRTLASHGIVCRWESVSAPDLYARLRPRHRVDSEAEFLAVANVSLLFLDDLGSAKATEWTEEINYRLINHRYERQLPTLITSNVVPADFPTAFGERVSSRLKEMCSTAVLKGEDRRRKPTP